MKKVLKLSGVILAAYILLVKTGLLSAVALLFLVGTVPGTDYILSPFSTILAMLVTATGVSGCINQSFGKALLAFLLRYTTSFRQLPRRRYTAVST